MPDSTIVPPLHRQRSFSPASPQLKHLEKPDRNSHHHQHRPNLSHQAPLSPPASTSPSNLDASASPSPRVSNLTPLSAPMSAEPSQQSFTQTSSHEESQSTTEPLQSNTQPSSISQPILGGSQTQPHDQINRPEKHKLDVADLEHSGAENESNKRRRTDHDRVENHEALGSSPILAAGSTSHLQPQSFYKLLSLSHVISQPHSSQNLFALYGLEDVAASVARNDPVTGEKINKLRKSYEGKVKELAGRNKAVNKPGELSGLVHYPDEEWQIQKVMGKEINADFSDEFLARLSNATKLGPGKLPAEEDGKWRSSLGLDDVSWKTMANNAAPVQQPSTDKALAGQGSTSPSTTAAGEPLRPKRRGTKRRYDDDSFEGYGEGYIDDGGDVFSNEGDEDGRANAGIRRKRRKDSTSASFSGPAGNISSNSGGGGGGGAGGGTSSITTGGFRPSSPQNQPSSASVSVGVGSYGGR